MPGGCFSEINSMDMSIKIDKDALGLEPDKVFGTAACNAAPTGERGGTHSLKRRRAKGKAGAAPPQAQPDRKSMQILFPY